MIKHSIFYLSLLLFSSQLFSQSTAVKNYSGEFADLQEFRIEHRRGSVEIRPSKDNKLRYEGQLNVTASSKADADLVISKLDFRENLMGTTLELTSAFNVTMHSINNRITKMKFGDGTKVKNVGDITFNIVIYIPALKHIYVENKYHDISIYDNFSGDISINLRSGRLKAQNFGGEMELKSRYSKIYLGNAQDLDLDLYDCEMEMGNAEAVKLKSKYSELEFGRLKSLRAELHDDELEVEAIAGKFDLIDKYSELEIGDFNTGVWKVHDGKFICKKAESLEISSKYSEFRFDQIGSLEFDSSHDDDLDINKLEHFKAESKYSEFDIDYLGKSLKVNYSHDDKIEIDELGNAFDEIELDGKYTDMSIDLHDQQKYHLDVTMQYGKVNIDEDNFETKIWKENDNTREIKGNTKGATDQHGKVIVRGHQNNVMLR